MGLAAGNSNHEKLFLELKLTVSSSGRGRGDPMLPWGGLRRSVLLHRLFIMSAGFLPTPTSGTAPPSSHPACPGASAPTLEN